jgi:hypothetical protein
MVPSMKEIGQMDFFTEKVTFIGLIIVPMKDLTNWEKNMVKVNICMLPKKYIEVIGIMENKAEKVSLLIDQETSLKKAFGKMENILASI